MLVALGGDAVPSPVASLADAGLESALHDAGLEPLEPLEPREPLSVFEPPAPLGPPGPARPLTLATDAEPPKLSRPHLRAGITATLVGAGLFTTATAATWIVADRTGAVGRGVRSNAPIHSIAMGYGGFATAGGALVLGLAGRSFGKALPFERPRLGAALLGTGTTVAILGAGAMFTVGILGPTIDDACPIGMGCTLAGFQSATLLASAGLGMARFGAQLRPRTQPRLDRRLRESWVTGTALTTLAYLGAVAGGTLTWQADRDSLSRRRARNRMLVPIAGPFIAAAAPDVPLIFAGFAALSGALQVGGAITLAVSAGITVRTRRGERAPAVRDVVVVPSGNGIAISGRF